MSSNPAGIDCSSICAANFGENIRVTLTATPAEGSTFAGWSDACSSTDVCVVTMSQAQVVTATFTSMPIKNEYVVFLPLVTR